MLDNNKTNTSTYSAVAIMVAIAAASTGDFQIKAPSDAELSAQSVYVAGAANKASGDAIVFYNSASEEISAANSEEGRVKIRSIKMQLRHQAIERSFAKHSEGFPIVKKNYIIQLANQVCKLPFYDNISSYNIDDESIDTILKLTDGTTLSLSQFLNDDVESPVVFSIHRNKTLLVADELPLTEIVQTINSVIAKHNGSIV